MPSLSSSISPDPRPPNRVAPRVTVSQGWVDARISPVVGPLGPRSLAPWRPGRVFESNSPRCEGRGRRGWPSKLRAFATRGALSYVRVPGSNVGKLEHFCYFRENKEKDVMLGCRIGRLWRQHSRINIDMPRIFALCLSFRILFRM